MAREKRNEWGVLSFIRQRRDKVQTLSWAVINEPAIICQVSLREAFVQSKQKEAYEPHGQLC